MLRSYKRSAIQYRHRAVNYLLLTRRHLRPNDSGVDPALYVAPTLVAYAETTYAGLGASKTTASISWLTGDIIVVIAGTEDQVTTCTPTATGLSFSADGALTVGSTCWADSWRATAASDGSSVVTLTRSGLDREYGCSVWVFRGSDGVSTRATGSTTAKTLDLARTGIHSFVVESLFDFSAAATTSHVWTPTGETEREATQASGYTAYVANWGDQGGDGTTTYGITGTASTGAHTKIALEILGTLASGGTDAAAEATTATATAETPSVSVATNAAEASATAAANAATAGVGPNAESAAAIAATDNASTTVSTNAADAATTSTAETPAASVAVNAEAATATAEALDATVSVTVGTNAPAEAAEATATAETPSVGISPAPTEAASSASAEAPAPSVAVNAEAVGVTAAANDATVSTASMTNAPAETASATAAANDSAASVAVSAESAAATGTAHDPAPSVGVPANAATAAAAANDATVAFGRDALAEAAEASGAAVDPMAAIAAAVEAAFASAEAWDATIGVPVPPLTDRPDTGDTPRPVTTSSTRPGSGGQTSAPGSGLTLRPVTTSTPRP